MPTESIQFAPSARPAVQAGAQQAAASAAQTAPAAVLGGPSVSVTVSGSSLDKLVAKVKGESEDARLAAAKRRIAVVLTVLTALNIQITENQKNSLAQLEVLQAQLDELAELLAGKESGGTAAKAKVAALEAQIQALKNAVENAIKDGEAHRKQVEELRRTRKADDAELKKAEADLAKAEASIAAAQANLYKAQSDLMTAKAAVETSKKDIADLKAQISGLEAKIADCAAAVGDKALAAIAAGLRADAADVEPPEPRETQADREKEEAKQIANDPLRAIRDALDRMDEDVRRTIEDNKTILV
ncbi:MAG: hypothetical protein IJV65_06930 [Kiritimatiellae bacterium]|nr:hypothetical protein [Kiritimatiellia bacterium]